MTLVTSYIIGPFLCCHLLYLIIYLDTMCSRSMSLTFWLMPRTEAKEHFKCVLVTRLYWSSAKMVKCVKLIFSTFHCLFFRRWNCYDYRFKQIRSNNFNCYQTMVHTLKSKTSWLYKYNSSFEKEWFQNLEKTLNYKYTLYIYIYLLPLWPPTYVFV